MLEHCEHKDVFARLIFSDQVFLLQNFVSWELIF